DGDLVGVDPAVVVPAQEHPVLDVGASEVLGPPQRVVDLAEAGWLVAAGVLAVLVPRDDGADLVGGEDPLLAAGVEDGRDGPEDHPGDLGLAGEPGQHRGWD